jgi:magnesium transporter
MRLAHLIGPEMKDLLHEDPEQVVDLLDEVHAEDLADVVLELDDREAGELLKRLPAEAAADIFERLPQGRQEALVPLLGMQSTARIATEMSADDRADLFSALPEDVGEALLETLEKVDPEAAEEVEQIARWPETSAGHLMTTDFIAVGASDTAAEAIERIRTHGKDVEVINYLYVLSDDGRLIGVASLRDVLIADPKASILSLMMENVITVAPEDDQEAVARMIQKYDVQALPVVDSAGKLLGIITVDDVMDVVTAEHTEDVHRMAGVQPIEDPYFETTFWTFIKKRAGWLLALFVSEFFTGTALRHYDQVLQSVSQLAFYVPLLISTGGNSGSQSSTLVIRGMAVGEIRLRDWYRVLVREMSQGVVLGLILAAVGTVRVLMWRDGITMASLIAATLVCITVMGCTVGSMLPLVIKRVGFDPATSSAPFIASLVDVLGLVIYFNLAKVLLAQVLSAAQQMAR